MRIHVNFSIKEEFRIDNVGRKKREKGDKGDKGEKGKKRKKNSKSINFL
jgi:hypothetical protein